MLGSSRSIVFGDDPTKKMESDVVKTSFRGGFLQRYILRKDFFRKVRERLRQYSRVIRKNAFSDLRFLLQAIPVHTVFDVGANIGYITDAFLHAFPKANIYCFEPTPTTFEVLQKRLGNSPYTKLYNQAVSDESGRLTFYLNRNSGTCSLLEPETYNKLTWARKSLNPIEVSVISLDEFCSREKISEIDLLKLDIEGSELKALQGAQDMLERSKIALIYTEVVFVPLYKNQPLFHQIVQYLHEVHYALYNVYGVVESPIRQGLISNAIFLSPEMRACLLDRHGLKQCGWSA